MRLLKIPTYVAFLVKYFVNLGLANIKLAKVLFQKEPNIHPAIVKVPINITNNYQVLLVANLITYTPGTLTVDWSEESRSFLIHYIFSENTMEVIGAVTEDYLRIAKELFP